MITGWLTNYCNPESWRWCDVMNIMVMSVHLWYTMRCDVIWYDVMMMWSWSTWYVEPLNKQVEKLNRCGEGAVRCEERLQVHRDDTCTQANPDHIIFSSFPRVSIYCEPSWTWGWRRRGRSVAPPVWQVSLPVRGNLTLKLNVFLSCISIVLHIIFLKSYHL